MTDNYERMNIDGKNYVLVPEELWSEDSHDTRTEPNPAWLDYVLADDARINADIGLYSNLLLPLGSLMREDDNINDQVPQLLSRTLRTLLSVIWTEEEGWLPEAQVTEGWYFDPALVLLNLSKTMQTDKTETALVAFKEITDEYAAYLQTILSYEEVEEVDDDTVEETSEQ